MRAIGVQMDIVWENAQANFDQVEELLSNETINAGDLIVLPEMFASGFTMNVSVACDARGDSKAFLQKIASRYQSTVIAGVASLASDEKGKNQALVINPAGEEICRYTKLHPFTFGKEHQHYLPGNEICAFQYAGFTIAPFVCYDLRFPEIFRIAARHGADCMAVIANWPSKRVDHWITLLKARAIENQSCIIGVNRCGNDPYLPYPGRSLIIDPHGNVLAEAGDQKGTISAEMDPKQVQSWRNEFGALADMRRDFLK